MEKVIETVKLTMSNGSEVTFEVVEDASRFSGQRAYLKGSTQYFDMPVFEAGVKKAASVTRTPA